MSKQLRLDVAQLTDVGRKRPHNEDNMAYVIPKDSQVMTKKGALFIVADGMGGHAAGEVASEIAVDTVSNVYYQDECDDIPLSLMNAIKRANALIHQRAAENMMRSGMGTTCVAAVVCGGVAYIANVGDSRAYMVRHGQVKQISQDHSWVEEQVRAGLLTKEQARSHAQRNVITRALGTQAEVEVDVFTEILEDEDTFVLCSDGLSGPVGEEDLRAIINQYLPQESVYHLVERANDNGGPDNITAIVVRIQEAGDDVPENLQHAQHPVHAGGTGHVADERTAVLGRVPTSSLGVAAAARVEDSRVNSRPLRSPSGQLFASPGSVTAPLAVVASTRRKRSRLLLPTIVIFVLLLVAVGAGGAYLYLWPSGAQAALDQADKLITQANTNVSTRPGDALTQLMRAQDQLRAAKNTSLNSQQSSQLTSLQNNLTSEFRSALTNYNQQSAVVTLPCKDLRPATLNDTDVKATTMATVKVDKDHSATFILGFAGDLFEVGDQQNLKNVTPSGADKIVLLANDAQYLYALTTPKSGNAMEYRLRAYQWQNGKLAEKTNGGTLIKPADLNGQTPQLLTAWDGDIYAIATSSQANLNQATLLHYRLDKLSNNVAPDKYLISISTSLVSAVAFPGNQLFLLHNDGRIKGLHVTGNAPLEADVVVQGTVATPWSQDTQTFTAATPIAMPTDPIAKFLTIPPSNAQSTESLLSAGIIDKTPHLFIVDNVNHRVLNFAVPTVPAVSAPPVPSATPNLGGNVMAPSAALAAPMVKLVQQYVSPTVVSGVRGIVFDTRVNQINLLEGAKNSANASTVAINVASTTACTATP